MSAGIDLYRVLQVRPDAEPRTIRAAYRGLAWRYHPDVGGSQRAMAALNEAWRILRDPVARARYDRLRLALKVGEPAQGTPAARPGGAKDKPSRPEAREAWPAVPHVVNRAPTGRSAPADRRDGSTVLDFGRYEGWSLEQLSGTDPDYLEWLARTSIGRRLQPEIAALLAARRRVESARRDASGQVAKSGRRWPRATPASTR
jgi:curved DNA-binding protein CbpA